jgi:FdhD protein
VRGTECRERPDRLVTEEPLEIRVDTAGHASEPVAVTMRTPGHDFDLAAGFLLTEQLAAPEDVESVSYCTEVDRDQRYNTVTVRLRQSVPLRDRRFTVNASCGICGATTIADALRDTPPVGRGPTVRRSVLAALPDALRQHQDVFDATGGLHAAGVFRADGTLVLVREDVGRHNALDKVIGNLGLAGGLPARDLVLAVSGRISFEIVQKAAVAGIPVITAVSAPSSLAVEAARRTGQTLVGFLRDEGFNLYTGVQRVALEA